MGVGSGRFAAALDVGYGIDPAWAPLVLAAGRGIHVVQAVGERLPFPDRSFGAILLVVTLCFADDPHALLAEARRVLREDGAVVLGDVLAESRWGQHYRALGAEGHPFYSAARFLTREETLDALRQAGLRLARVRSTLLQPPTEEPVPEPALEGENPEAGFAGWQSLSTASLGRPRPTVGTALATGPSTHVGGRAADPKSAAAEIDAPAEAPA